MRVVLPAFASVLLLAGSALAQTAQESTQNPAAGPGGSINSGMNTSGSSDMNTSDSSRMNLPGSSGRTMSSTNTPQLTESARQALRQSLERNGFKNVQVVPEAFAIRAQAPDGSRLMMQVGPDQFAELVEPGTGRAATSGTKPSMPPQSGSSMPSGTQQQGASGVSTDTSQRIRQSLEQNGFKNVQVMPEAFVIRAQAPDGSHLVMEVTPDQVAGIVAAPATSSGSSSNEPSSGSSSNPGPGLNNTSGSGVNSNTGSVSPTPGETPNR